MTGSSWQCSTYLPGLNIRPVRTKPMSPLIFPLLGGKHFGSAPDSASTLREAFWFRSWKCQHLGRSTLGLDPGLKSNPPAKCLSESIRPLFLDPSVLTRSLALLQLACVWASRCVFSSTNVARGTSPQIFSRNVIGGLGKKPFAILRGPFDFRQLLIRIAPKPQTLPPQAHAPAPVSRFSRWSSVCSTSPGAPYAKCQHAARAHLQPALEGFKREKPTFVNAVIEAPITRIPKPVWWTIVELVSSPAIRCLVPGNPMKWQSCEKVRPTCSNVLPFHWCLSRGRRLHSISSTHNPRSGNSQCRARKHQIPRLCMCVYIGINITVCYYVQYYTAIL